ncbi:hypothetical protein MSSIT_1829 [Methanosarcina siciliae T4/M]|uniref:Uncharacterized protein n=1 Tax=Methanosarcina siciliae T4/M TaxID=1434120 RepID=A0A0E3P4M4_9EURY|nr:hypothetical protein MSSIT_1829 [Methanosarcina siciliae T4/M]
MHQGFPQLYSGTLFPKVYPSQQSNLTYYSGIRIISGEARGVEKRHNQPGRGSDRKRILPGRGSDLKDDRPGRGESEEAEVIREGEKRKQKRTEKTVGC